MHNTRDDLASGPVPGVKEPVDPEAMARRDQQKGLPKRFFKEAVATVDRDLFALMLDGRKALTPARNPLAVPTSRLAQAIADEWSAQVEYIDPAHMPLTRIVNSALDGVAREMDATAAEIVKYAGSDLLCYRAEDPEALVEEQVKAWDPVLEWIATAHGARFRLAGGIVFERQPMDAIMNFRQAVENLVDAGAEGSRPLRLAGLHVMTTLTGSAILALAVATGHLSAADAWRAAHVDEDFQARLWGEDGEAKARRERRWRDMAAAALVLQG